MKKILVLTDKNFKKEVLQSKIPVLVDFWASWCPPCKMAEPIIENLAQKLDSIVKVAKINVDQNPISASKHKIMGVPIFIIFINGKEIVRRVGAQSKGHLLDMFQEAGIKI